VAQAMVDLIVAAIYPNGTSAASAVGVNVRAFVGWPVPGQQAKDFAADIVQVSVYPTRVGKELPTFREYADGEIVDHKATRTTVLRREQRQFQVTIWASCFDRRESVAAAVDAVLEDIDRLTLSDGSAATIAFVNAYLDDSGQKQGIYRMDLFYLADYFVTKQEELDEIRYTEINLSGGPSTDAQGPVVTETQP
jgi:hypothetical protein